MKTFSIQPVDDHDDHLSIYVTEHEAYVHKIHLFVLWYIFPLLFKILKFCKLD